MGHAFAAPGGEIRDEDVVLEVRLGFEVNPPTSRPAAAAVGRDVEFAGEHGRRFSVRGCRPRVRAHGPVHGFGDQVRGCIEDVLVGRLAWCAGLVGGCGHVERFCCRFDSDSLPSNGLLYSAGDPADGSPAGARGRGYGKRGRVASVVRWAQTTKSRVRPRPFSPAAKSFRPVAASTFRNTAGQSYHAGRSQGLSCVES